MSRLHEYNRVQNIEEALEEMRRNLKYINLLFPSP